LELALLIGGAYNQPWLAVPTWPVGQSWRAPRGEKEIHEFARQHAPAAIQALAEALKDPRTRVAERAALSSQSVRHVGLLQRGYFVRRQGEQQGGDRVVEMLKL